MHRLSYKAIRIFDTVDAVSLDVRNQLPMGASQSISRFDWCP
jgi:hypothetical protein